MRVSERKRLKKQGDKILKALPPTYDFLHKDGLRVVLGLAGAGGIHSLHTHIDPWIRRQTCDGELGLVDQFRICNYPVVS